MTYANQALMAIVIVLPEDEATPGKTHDTKVRHGGDVLKGYLEVTTGIIFDFEIYVSFEGSS